MMFKAHAPYIPEHQVGLAFRAPAQTSVLQASVSTPGVTVIAPLSVAPALRVMHAKPTRAIHRNKYVFVMTALTKICARFVRGVSLMLARTAVYASAVCPKQIKDDVRRPALIPTRAMVPAQIITPAFSTVSKAEAEAITAFQNPVTALT